MSPRQRILVLGVVATVLLACGLGWHWYSRRHRLLPVTIETTDFLVSGPLLVAEDYGEFAAEGLTVRLRFHQTGKEAIATMAATGSGYATASDTPLMHAACAGQPFAILATISESRDEIKIVARRGAGIASPADLRGRRVGTTAGTNADFYLRSHLALNGIAPAEVGLEVMAPDEAVRRLVAGELDAACLWEPHLQHLRTQLGEHEIVFHEPALYRFPWNLLRGAGPADPELEQRLLRAILRASRRIEHDASVRAWLGRHLGMTAAAAEQAIAVCYFRPHLNHGLITGMEEQARVLLADPSTAVDFSRIIDPSALLAVDPNAVRLIR